MNSESSQFNINHVAIIMDGNGRWAKTRSHPRVWGHIRGSGVVADIVEAADDFGVKALTLYAFSTENWCRPEGEVKVLFKLLHKFLLKEKARILANDICFKIIGDISNLPSKTKDLIDVLEKESSANKGLKLTFAFGYGSRDEIVMSVNKFIEKNPGKKISVEDISQNLYQDNSEIDLLIRTGGDQRISNFLLWQIAYAELFFTETKWPEFSREEFKEILDQISKRERRFGAISNSSNLRSNIDLAKLNKATIRG